MGMSLTPPVLTGAQLKRWRERQGWTAEEAGRWYGISKNAWDILEGTAGQKRPMPMTLVRRIQDYEWVARQGYSPSPGVAPRRRG